MGVFSCPAWSVASTAPPCFAETSKTVTRCTAFQKVWYPVKPPMWFCW